MADPNRKHANKSPISEPTDGSLLREIRIGDEEAATELFHRYEQRLRHLATREMGQDLFARFDPEDVTQSVFRSLFQRVQEGQYSVPDEDTIWRLLVTIALNKIRSLGMYHRAAKRDITRTAQVFDHHTSRAKTEEAAYHQLRLTVQELLQRLTESQCTIIELRLTGERVHEIAMKTSRSKRTVERTLQGFRQMLQQTLTDEI